jgi:adenylate kinase
MQGGNSLCLRPPPSVTPAWHLVLLGPPGIGKGTQASLLSAALGTCPLSTGDIFRAGRAYEAPPGTAMGEALARIDRGELVPDDVVIAMIHERRRCLRCRGGFMLDGYPRTLAQAISLDAVLQMEHVRLDAVINYESPFDRIAARVAGRRVCENCHAVYHLTTRPPRIGGICDACGAIVQQRKDDEPSAVNTRLKVYMEATAGVAEHYRAQGLLVSVSAEGDPADTMAATLRALTERGLPAPPRPV